MDKGGSEGVVTRDRQEDSRVRKVMVNGKLK
jgi:hypothetical protein